MRPKSILSLFALSLAGLICSSCHSSTHAAQHSVSQAARANSAATYTLRGVVVAVDTANGRITLTNENIPGLMQPMTMVYTLANPTEATALHPGDKISAQLTTGQNRLTLDQLDILVPAQFNIKPTVQYHIPQPGDVVPDFQLINQNGHRIHLHQYRGKALLLTFVYTRCPLSNYCPLMSRNFAAVDKMLAADPALYAHTHLLTISFDPAYDTSAVLRSYGEAYTGRYTQEQFRHWEFSAPKANQLASLLQWFGVGVTPAPGGMLAHSLSTVVIGPNGKVRNWYPTNDWTPAQVFHDIRAALAVPLAPAH